MKPIFYLLILFLPTQLGRHFWPNFSFIQGLRVDYLSPTIYLTDLLLVLLVLSWGWPKFSIFNFRAVAKAAMARRRQFSIFLRKYWIFVVLVFIGSLGIYFSQSLLVGVYGLARLLLFTLFGTYVAKTITTQRQIEKITLFLMVGIFFESSLAIWQFAKQASIGGVFWFFGERTFTSEVPGIARAIIDGQSILRPYGTFPHPNVLAGFLIVAMTLAISNIKKIFFGVALIIGTVTLLLIMSRLAIITWLVTFSLKKFKFTIYYLLFTILLLGTVFYFSPLSSRLLTFSITEESFVRRVELTLAALEMIKTHPFIGVGLNNFLVNLPEFQQTRSAVLYLQPVHNIYLLVAAETGLIGLSLFLWFIVKTYQRIRRQLTLLLTIVLLLGLFDHYWLTLQQGQLLFALILGLSWAKIKG